MSYWLIAPGPFRGVGHIRMVSPRWPPGSTWSVFMAGAATSWTGPAAPRAGIRSHRPACRTRSGHSPAGWWLSAGASLPSSPV